jgi:hypothetical protein
MNGMDDTIGNGANAWLDMLLYGEFQLSLAGPQIVLTVMLLAFCVGHIIGWIYMATHTSLSYSQMFVASLVAVPVIVSLVMLLMAGNISIAFGLLAVFAVVRFRNVLKDTRDTVFILWGIIQGMAIGTGRFPVAMVGCLLVSLIFLYLRFTAFGSRYRYDVVLSLHWTGGAAQLAVLKPILKRHAVRAKLSSQRTAGDQGLDLSYQVLLRDPERSRELISELQTTEGVAHASLYHKEDESEI